MVIKTSNHVMYLRAFGDEKERLVSHLKQRVDEEKRKRVNHCFSPFPTVFADFQTAFVT